MTTLDVPRDGHASFHRLGVRALRDMLLAEEARRPDPQPNELSRAFCERIITTYLRPVAYVWLGLGT